MNSDNFADGFNKLEQFLVRDSPSVDLPNCRLGGVYETQHSLNQARI
jgi:hypothetical protein